MEYPRELLQIQVLDDSTDDTTIFAGALCERYRNMGTRSNICIGIIAKVTKAGRSRKA